VNAVATAARIRGVPVIVVVGGVGSEEHALYDIGIAAIVPLPTHPMTLVEAMGSAAPLVSRAVERALRLIRIGAQLTRSRKSDDEIQPGTVESRLPGMA
jgi:glycerate kinase